MNAKVDEYLNKVGKWQQEMEELRRIVLDCGLNEAFKWGKPCYTFQESNIVIIQGFKDSCALMFFKGVLLDDADDILEKPGENSRISRRIPFTGVQEIVEMESSLKSYIYEAIEAERAGLEVNLEKNPEPVPEEFQKKLDENPALKQAFEALTPGRQRAYILHFSGAKQSKTRERRVKKYIPKILEGKGLQDR
ncbi:MAG TPA: YdeI/OmpD-associated family protein [Balneolaceae bacterium]|nr:YdeI/OmpD-associated family protein [Balneolaceae bacterium]